MSEDRVGGMARNATGKIEERVDRLTGDSNTRARGKLDQAVGTAQDLYGQASDLAGDSAAAVNDWVRTNVETRPYTTALVALGLGWLLGRMHRPL